MTATPLLGLLGTILGIMQTFTALAAGGVSDPAAVSKGSAPRSPAYWATISSTAKPRI